MAMPILFGCGILFQLVMLYTN